MTLTWTTTRLLAAQMAMKKKHNGKQGELKEWLADKGRWTVRLDSTAEVRATGPSHAHS